MAMTIAQLRAVRALAHEVVDLTAAVERDVVREQRRRDPERTTVIYGMDEPLLSGTKNSGELRRRSMDLTRALAKLRGRAS